MIFVEQHVTVWVCAVYGRARDNDGWTGQMDMD